MFLQHGDADEVIDAGRYRSLGDAAQSGVHEHRLTHSQLVDQRVELRTVAELALGVLYRPRHAVPGQERVTRSGAYVTRQYFERCRLSGTVDAQKSKTLALNIRFISFSLHYLREYSWQCIWSRLSVCLSCLRSNCLKP